MTDPEGITIEPLSSHEDLQACVALQEATWGEAFSQRVPLAILLIAARIGGVVSGARLPDGSLAGFVFGLTGLERGELVHWSDMLAVRGDCRGRGIGTALKLHQRERALELGVRRMYWTFDPLEARNGKLNLSRFGAVVREYVPNMYGAPTSPLHVGIGTDRFLALWLLDPSRVRARVGASSAGVTLAGPASQGGAERPRALEWEWEEGNPAPDAIRLDLDADRILVPVPSDIQALKARRPDLAVRWREATREVFRGYLARGWEVREVETGGELPEYLLVRDRSGDGTGDGPR